MENDASSGGGGSGSNGNAHGNGDDDDDDADLADKMGQMEALVKEVVGAYSQGIICMFFSHTCVSGLCA